LSRAGEPERGLRAWLDERLGLEGLRRLAEKKHVPVHRMTPFYYLGGMALFLFVVQVATGMLLPARPGTRVRERAAHHDRGGVRLAHPVRPLVGRQPSHRGAPPAPPHDLRHAGLSPAPRAHVGHRRAPALRLHGLRVQRLPAAVERALLLGDPRRDGDRRRRAARGGGPARSRAERRERHRRHPCPLLRPPTSST